MTVSSCLEDERDKHTLASCQLGNFFAVVVIYGIEFSSIPKVLEIRSQEGLPSDGERGKQDGEIDSCINGRHA